MSSNINFMLLTTDLNVLLKQQTNICIIDVRDKEDYASGHIYNAINIPEIFTYLPEGLTTKKEKKDFVDFYENVFSNAGIEDDTLVVLYEDKFTLKSPRGVSILKYLGFNENNIKVLDGGYDTWCKNNFKTTNEIIHNKKSKFISNVNESFFVDYDEMLKIIYDEKIVTLDTRDKDEWLGISASPYGIDFAPKKGRLPNAIWMEWYQFITNDMLSVASLEKIKFELLKMDIRKNNPIVLYCFKGARVSNTYIALRLLGYENIRIYFAGWNEWCRKENAPIINEVENNNNPILQENIALKKKLAEINLKKATLINFPKHNTEPIFSFNREGSVSFENEPKKIYLADIKNFTDIYPNATQSDIFNIIDNETSMDITIKNNKRHYLLKYVGSREANSILFYGFNVTEIKTLHNELKDNYILLNDIVDNVPVRIFWKNLEGQYIGANQLFLRDANLNHMEDLIGKTDFDLQWASTGVQGLRNEDISIMKSGKSVLNFEETLTNQNGDTMIISISKVPLRCNENKITGILGCYNDVTKQRNIENELRNQKIALAHQAHHDALTKLPNRVLFNDRLQQALDKAKRKNLKVALLFIDLDYFKEINDTLGHNVGDEVLIRVAKILKKAIREVDTLARLGGDEFTIIVEEVSQIDNVSIVAKKILSILSKPIKIKEHILYVSSSIGISIYPDDGNSTLTLLKYADLAMYKAKNGGRNNFQYYIKQG